MPVQNITQWPERFCGFYCEFKTFTSYHWGYYKIPETNYKLQITNYKLQITNYKLQITNFKFQNYKFDQISFITHTHYKQYRNRRP
jgi:hypothetical protein